MRSVALTYPSLPSRFLENCKVQLLFFMKLIVSITLLFVGIKVQGNWGDYTRRGGCCCIALLKVHFETGTRIC